MWMNGTTTKMMRHVLKRYGQVTIHDDYNYNRIPLIIQRIARLPPPPTLLIGLGGKQLDMIQQLERFAQEIRRTQQTEAFTRQFEMETARLTKILNDPSGDNEYLLFDFQFMLDTAGRFFYIDLDRGLKGKLKECKKCLDISSLAPGMEKLLFWLTQATSEDFLQLQQDFQEYQEAISNNSDGTIGNQTDFGKYFFQYMQKTIEVL